jgi:hypothetical protein
MPEETKTVITARADVATDKQQAAVTIVTMPAWKIAFVRCVRVYLQSVLGFLTAGVTGATSAVGAALGAPMPAMDFWHQLLFALSLAVAPATVSLIQNICELLAKIDASNPTLRA